MVDSSGGSGPVTKAAYIQTVGLFERLHRRFLDVIRTELERLHIGDINNVQALILFNIGDREYTVSEIMQRGHYLGTNVTYNLAKLSTSGYLIKMPSAHDRRSVHVRLSEKGILLWKAIDAACDAHVRAIRGRIEPVVFADMTHAMQALEQVWNEFVDNKGVGAVRARAKVGDGE
ncbi:MAG TPA: winged helix DNA-binding protein [Alphaproteobacteria bacterium]|nr:winged helix DNA-binding protein [Alphaproteobacteria bacterium]